jgi:phytoene dehydrogenase-like protein
MNTLSEFLDFQRYSDHATDCQIDYDLEKPLDGDHKAEEIIQRIDGFLRQLPRWRNWYASREEYEQARDSLLYQKASVVLCQRDFKQGLADRHGNRPRLGNLDDSLAAFTEEQEDRRKIFEELKSAWMAKRPPRGRV